jgi:hypothetical protein
VVRIGGYKFVLLDDVQNMISDQIANRTLGPERLVPISSSHSSQSNGI